jgi:hypothetical protein
VIGVTTALNAPADGYTFLLTQGSAIVVVPRTIKGVKYDFNRDFVPVAMVATSPLVIAVRTDSPFRTLADLVQAAKTKPEAIEVADVGLYTIPHLAAANLAHNAGVRFLHMHFQGGPAAMQDTLGGHAKAVFETLGPILGMVQGGKLRVLASMSDRVEKGLEKYPLAQDTVPGAVAQGWFSLIARKGTDSAWSTRSMPMSMRRCPARTSSRSFTNWPPIRVPDRPRTWPRSTRPTASSGGMSLSDWALSLSDTCGKAGVYWANALKALSPREPPDGRLERGFESAGADMLTSQRQLPTREIALEKRFARAVLALGFPGERKVHLGRLWEFARKLEQPRSAVNFGCRLQQQVDERGVRVLACD